MKAQHTPGPWSVEYHPLQDGKGGDSYAIIRTNTGKVICQVSTWTDEKEANARLIAAAPELLEVLENARIALTFYREWMARHETGLSYPFGDTCETEALAAIRKAKGE